jgi:hypothetical protein
LKLAQILALMFALIPPGKSLHSTIGDRLETFEEGARRYATIARAICYEAAADKWLALMLLIATFHESGWRLDVHDGRNHAPELRGTKIEDRQRSWCLVQRLLGPKSEYGRSLTGTDLEATRRCIAEGAFVLRRVRRWAPSSCGPNPTCWWVGYGGGEVSPRHRYILDRVKTYRRVRIMRPALSPRVLELLPWLKD